ncbi:MAG: hypothetical protein AB7O32_14065 [Vicinamibacterales bacterium]
MALPTTSVTGEFESLALLIGDWAVGAVTFRLDPSGFKSAAVGAVALGEAGGADCLLQATTMAIVHTGTKANLSIRAINSFSQEQSERGRTRR